MTSNNLLRYSVLDLVPVTEGGSPARSLRNSLELARHAERWGCHRYWVAEHHNIPGVACSATAVVIGFLAGGTERIRVGSGGIMLPNHSPLIVAEQFGTLASLYPGRIDLGLGRAPGGDQATARAIRRDFAGSADSFPEDVAELQRYLAPRTPGRNVQAIPGQGMQVPLYLLGSSMFSARLAAKMGLPFAFASHFAPELLHDALEIYHTEFRASSVLSDPYAMLGANLIAADTPDEAAVLSTTLSQLFLNLLRGRPREMPAPVQSMDGRWTAAEEHQVRRMTRVSLIGDADLVRRQAAELIRSTGVREIILTVPIHDQAARLRSLEIGIGALREVAGSTSRTEAVSALP